MQMLRRMLVILVAVGLLGACGVSWRSSAPPIEEEVVTDSVPDRSEDPVEDPSGEDEDEAEAEVGSTTADERDGEGDGADVEVSDALDIVGDPLPLLVDGGEDEAIGMRFPEITGTGIDGKPLTIGDTGLGKVVVVTAHWCPHCQEQIPELVAHLEKNPLPDGVEIYGFTSAIDESRDNFPPSRWLQEEEWPAPTLLDDPYGYGALALGVGGFPTFIVVDADGRIVSRTAGSVEMEEFGRMIDAAAR